MDLSYVIDEQKNHRLTLDFTCLEVSTEHPPDAAYPLLPLQLTLSTWRANGGVGNPANASRAHQITVAERVLTSQGIGAWPVCGKRAGNITPTVATPSPSRPPTSTGATSNYTVASGDTLWSIAASHHVPGGWSQIYAANRGVVTDPNLVLIGQSLRILV